MAKTRAAKEAFDLTSGANEFLEEQEKIEPKQQGPSKRGKEKTESALFKEGVYVSIQLKLPREMHKRLCYEKLDRSDEKLTLSQIIVEALQEHWGESPTNKQLAIVSMHPYKEWRLLNKS